MTTSSIVDICAHCGETPRRSESQSLHKCSRCKSAAYCNRDCQRLHWKEHKAVCQDAGKAAFNDSTKPYSDRPANTIRATMTKKEAVVSKAMRDAKRNGDTIIGVTETAHGLVLPGMQLPKGVPVNFHLKQEAEFCFFTGPSRYGPFNKVITSNTKLSNLKYEKEYRNYYDDIVKNETEWMTFFDFRGNYLHAEHTCCILGSLATIYRQREGTYYKHCEEVLHMEEKVLKKFKQSIEGTNDKGKIQCYDGLEYRYHMLRFNVCIKNKRLNDAVPFFRKLLEYEVRNNLDYEHQQFLFLLGLIHLQPTPATVYNLTKTQILKLLNRLIELEKSKAAMQQKTDTQARVALMTCAGCSSTENAIGEYKSCCRCGKVFYCKKSCQKTHWKVHKKVCNKK